MRTIILGSVAILSVGLGGAWADEPVPAGQPATAAPADTRPVADAAAGIDTHPWNPDLGHANQWPYDKPLPIASDYIGPPGEFWFRFEYLMWFLKGDRPPPLVTAGPPGSGGVLGVPGVVTIFGGSALDQGQFSGGRITAGLWFDSDYTLGFEGTYFFLPERAQKFADASSGQPGSFDLARPFLNVLTGLQSSRVLASTGAAGGAVAVQAPTELQGAEGNMVWSVRRGPVFSFDVLAGFRYLDLGSMLIINDATIPVAGVGSFTEDLFSAHNHFYGGQVGGRAEFSWRSLVFDITEKIALGANTADIDIAGGPFQKTPVLPPGGLLAQPSNFGKHSDDTFSVVNEIGVQAGWRICDYVQVFAGYSFLYASSVVRPSNVVDFGVNPTVGVGPLRPVFARQETDFWAHGLNAGFEVRY